jgi:predicted RNA-binding protein YlxR (DUF448 family)
MMQVTTETTAEAPRRVRKDAGATAKLRRCVVTQTTMPRAALLRLVVSPDGVLTPDVAGRLPGRGIWVTPTRAAIAEGIQRKAFHKAFRGAVKVPDGFADQVERLLLQRLLDAIGLARRAGDAVAGAAKAEEWLANGRIGLVFLARDAGADARRRWQSMPDSIPRNMVLSGDEIGRAFSRDRAANLVVKNCPLKQRLIDDAGRLAGLRISGTGPDDAPRTGNGE